MDLMQAAIDEIESLAPGEHFTYAGMARKYGVNRTTLARRHKQLQSTETTKRINQQKLNPQQEKELVQYIDRLTERHLPPTREMIQSFASTIAKEPVSESWVSRFLSRQTTDLISRWTTGMDSQRHQADSEDKYRLYFQFLHDKIDQYGIDPQCTYNMDEKGFLIGVVGRLKRIFSRRMWEKKEVRASLQDGNRSWITVLACICADGSALPPALIYEAANKGIQSTWVEDIKARDDQVFITSSPSGWTNNDIGLAWLEQVFDRCTKPASGRSYRLLILDGHGSHISMDFIDYCDRNKILLAILPPHSTHTLQPLDVAMFKPLSTAYTAELSRYLHNSQGLVPITKGDFFPLFCDAWKTSFKKSTILSSFKSTGISPPDPAPILNRFIKDRESSSGSSSGISDHDWRKLDRLVRSAVQDQSSRDAQKLRASVHHLSVQNELLHHDIDGLRKALSIKKRRSKKGKTLDLQQREEYHGGSVFWSPRKVREAHTRLSITEQEKKEQQLQKAEIAEQKKANKLYKEQLQQAKRAAREKAKKEKEEEKAKQVAQRAAQKSANNSEKSLQLSQKGKRKVSQSSLQSRKRQKGGVDTQDTGEVSEGASATPTRSTRRGRSVKLPGRYQ